MKNDFERRLREQNFLENIIVAYLFAVKQFNERYDVVTLVNVRAYKVWEIENYKARTVSLRLRGINCSLRIIGKGKWKMPFVRVQQKSFLENVISQGDYEYFKTCVKRNGELL